MKKVHFKRRKWFLKCKRNIINYMLLFVCHKRQLHWSRYDWLLKPVTCENNNECCCSYKVLSLSSWTTLKILFIETWKIEKIFKDIDAITVNKTIGFMRDRMIEKVYHHYPNSSQTKWEREKILILKK